MHWDTSYLKEYFSTLQIRILMGDYTKCPPDWEDMNFLPDYYRIYYVADGKCWIKVGDEELYLEKGDFCWLPSGIPQQYRLTDKDNPAVHYWVHFHATLGGTLPLLDIIKVPYRLKMRDEQLLKEIFSDVVRLLNHPGGLGDEFLLKGRMLTLMAFYVNECKDRLHVKSPAAIEELKPAIDYIERNIAGPVTLEQLAALVCLHPNYFSQKFRNLTGMSPMSYLLKKRMEKARALLSGTSKPIGAIAEEVGFSSQFQFSSMFRKYAGMPPTAYRNTYKDRYP